MNVLTDESEVATDAPLFARLSETLRTRDIVLLLLSPAAARMEWFVEGLSDVVRSELSDRAITLIPAVTGDWEGLPSLESRHCLDLRHDPQDAVGRVVPAT